MEFFRWDWACRFGRAAAVACLLAHEPALTVNKEMFWDALTWGADDCGGFPRFCEIVGCARKPELIESVSSAGQSALRFTLYLASKAEPDYCTSVTL